MVSSAGTEADGWHGDVGEGEGAGAGEEATGGAGR